MSSKSHDHGLVHNWKSFLFELVFHLNNFSGVGLNSPFVTFFKKM